MRAEVSTKSKRRESRLGELPVRRCFLDSIQYKVAKLNYLESRLRGLLVRNIFSDLHVFQQLGVSAKLLSRESRLGGQLARRFSYTRSNKHAKSKDLESRRWGLLAGNIWLILYT